MPINRVVALAVSLLGLVAAIVAVVADMDLTSLGGLAAGLGTISLIAHKWLDGWQSYESDLRWDERTERDKKDPLKVHPYPEEIEPDKGDKGKA